MTTPTSKHVYRVTVDTYSSRIFGSKGRKIVVGIAGDFILFRQQGRRLVVRVPIREAAERAFSEHYLAEAIAEKAARKARRAARRGW
jgi:hypothetical protein